MSTLPQLPQNETIRGTKKFTYSDYADWEDDNRWELIDGVPRMMAAPSYSHQSILMALASQFYSFLRGKQCRIVQAPFDVRLNYTTRDDIVVQPDLLVVCDRDKLGDGKNLKGAPDLAIEILSPSSSKYDKTTKFKLYKQSGVREYWIVDPTDKTIAVYIFEQENLSMRYYDETETITVHALEGCEIDLSPVFED